MKKEIMENQKWQMMWEYDFELLPHYLNYVKAMDYEYAIEGQFPWQLQFQSRTIAPTKNALKFEDWLHYKGITLVIAEDRDIREENIRTILRNHFGPGNYHNIDISSNSQDIKIANIKPKKRWWYIW